MFISNYYNFHIFSFPVCTYLYLRHPDVTTFRLHLPVKALGRDLTTANVGCDDERDNDYRAVKKESQNLVIHILF